MSAENCWKHESNHNNDDEQTPGISADWKEESKIQDREKKICGKFWVKHIQYMSANLHPIRDKEDIKGKNK